MPPKAPSIPAPPPPPPPPAPIALEDPDEVGQASRAAQQAATARRQGRAASLTNSSGPGGVPLGGTQVASGQASAPSTLGGSS